MSDTALKLIEYVVVPGTVQLLGALALGLVERSRLKKEGKADPDRFTVKLPIIFIISLMVGFVVFTTITVFFNRQVINDKSVSIIAQVLLNIGMIALALTSLLYVYIYLRRKIEVSGGTVKITPAFSKPYTFTAAQVEDVENDGKEISFWVYNKKIKVYKICHCSGLFLQWLGRNGLLD